MNRISILTLLVAGLALVSHGIPVVAPSAGLAQEGGQLEAAANEDAADDDSGDEGSGTVSDPRPAGNGDSEEDEPANNTEQQNRDENEDEGAGTDEAASRSPVSPAQGVEAL